MAANGFGNFFRVTTFGESHGKALGVVIDGCPPRIDLTEEDILTDMARRAPGRNNYTTPRKEKDRIEILSGLFEGKTTGAPIAMIVYNADADSSKYEPIKDLLRPGHAQFTYLKKYGIFDYRGGGRASGRETLCRVAAGAVAKKILRQYGIRPYAYVRAIGGIFSSPPTGDFAEIYERIQRSPLFCPEEEACKKMTATLREAMAEGDSLGGIVEAVAEGVPAGWGDPIYEKLEANLAKAMISIPAAKGVEFGSGFAAASLKGSEQNDLFFGREGKTKTNFSGGFLGGISNGMPLVLRVAFKPPSGIAKPMETVDFTGEKTLFALPKGSRHDPCIAIRAVPVVEAMLALTLIDAGLMQQALERPPSGMPLA